MRIPRGGLGLGVTIADPRIAGSGTGSPPPPPPVYPTLIEFGDVYQAHKSLMYRPEAKGPQGQDKE